LVDVTTEITITKVNIKSTTIKINSLRRIFIKLRATEEDALVGAEATEDAEQEEAVVKDVLNSGQTIIKAIHLKIKSN